VVALQKEQASNLSPMDRLNAKAERYAQSGANLDKMVEAAKPLYESLDDAQKHTFVTLGRMLVPERGRFAKEMSIFGRGMAISTARSSNPLASAFRACLHGKKSALTMRMLDAVGREVHSASGGMAYF
jgi:hypothetical protein